MNNLTAQQKMKKARTSLILSDPFFGALALKMRLRQTSEDEIEKRIVNHSCVVDGKQIVYDPAFIDNLDLLQAKGLLAHEVAHVALKHNLRRGDRNFKIWNLAGDYVIDPILRSAGFKLPPVFEIDEYGAVSIVEGHFDDELMGKSIEQVYDILLARIKEQQKKRQEQLQNMQSDGDQDGDGEFDKDDDEIGGEPGSIPPRLKDCDADDEDDGTDDSDGDDGAADQSDDDNGGGEIDFDDLDIPNIPGTSVVLDYPMDIKDNTERDKIDQQQTLDVEDALRAAKMHGNMPAGLERLIEAGKEHKIYWYDELRDFMEKVTERGDYSWIAPSRRYISHGFVLPGLSEEEILPNIVVVCDTSGSIGDHELEQYAAEISNVLEEFNCRFTVIYCDTQVNNTEEFSIDDLPIKLNATGGGGTYFMPAFEHVRDNFEDAQAIVYFTDMDCFDWPQVRNYDPKLPVLWLDSYGGRVVNRPGFTLPFGKHILLELDETDNDNY